MDESYNMFPSWEAESSLDHDQYHDTEFSYESLLLLLPSLTTVPRYPPITQQSVVLSSMLMFRMGKEARKQHEHDDMFNPYVPVPISVLLRMTLVFVLFMAILIFLQASRKKKKNDNDSENNANSNNGSTKIRERLRQQLQSSFKLLRSMDVFVIFTALFG